MVGACDLPRVGCVEGVDRPESVDSEVGRLPPYEGSWVGCALWLPTSFVAVDLPWTGLALTNCSTSGPLVPVCNCSTYVVT